MQLVGLIFTNGLLTARYWGVTPLLITVLALAYLFQEKLPKWLFLEHWPSALLAWGILCTLLNVHEISTSDFYFNWGSVNGIVLWMILKWVKRPVWAGVIIVASYLLPAAISLNGLYNNPADVAVAQAMRQKISPDTLYFVSTPGCGSCVKAYNAYLDFSEKEPEKALPQVALMVVKHGTPDSLIKRYTHGDDYRIVKVKPEIYYQTGAPIIIHKSKRGALHTYKGYLYGWNEELHRYICWAVR